MTQTDPRGLVRALIVDDTPDIRLLLSMTLERDRDFAVVGEAGTGADGVRLARELQPDLVLLDLAMPVMDGFAALPQILQTSPASRVVVLSGFEAGTMAERAVAAGAAGYLQKGTSPDRILAFLRTLLEMPAPQRAVPASPPARPAVEGAPAPEAPPQSAASPSAASPSAASPPAAVVQRPDDREAVATPDRPDPVEALRQVAELAPFGLLLLGDAMNGPATIRYANPTAAMLVGDGADLTGIPLAMVSRMLTQVVERRRIELLSTDQVAERFNGRTGRFELVLRRAGNDLVASLQRVPETGPAVLMRKALSETAHEIRNPVTVILGVVETMQDLGESLPPAQAQQLLAALVRQAESLDRLAEDLLTVARTDRGTLAVSPERVSVDEVLGDALADLPGPALIDLVGDTGLHVQADPTRLRQIVANLLSNALKYGSAPYEVRVERQHSEVGPMVAVHVVDSGAGVEEAFRPLLFDEFTRAAGTQVPGTGLGLFLVRSLVHRMEGWAGYTPRPEGGSIFTVALPEAAGA